jgi:hypothetical protein
VRALHRGACLTPDRWPPYPLQTTCDFCRDYIVGGVVWQREGEAEERSALQLTLLPLLWTSSPRLLGDETYLG